jgi:hypothetical protein
MWAGASEDDKQDISVLTYENFILAPVAAKEAGKRMNTALLQL